MLDESHIHFIYGAKIYALCKTTGQAFVVQVRLVKGEQRFSYFEVEYDQLPERVKGWWKEYQEKTAADPEPACPWGT